MSKIPKKFPRRVINLVKRMYRKRTPAKPQTRQKGYVVLLPKGGIPEGFTTGPVPPKLASLLRLDKSLREYEILLEPREPKLSTDQQVSLGDLQRTRGQRGVIPIRYRIDPKGNWEQQLLDQGFPRHLLERHFVEKELKQRGYRIDSTSRMPAEKQLELQGCPPELIEKYVLAKKMQRGKLKRAP